MASAWVETQAVRATITQRPETFDRVDRIKQALLDAGEEADPIRSGDDRLWILGSPLIVEVDDHEHEVATGFTTDGASIPRWGQLLTGWEPWEPPQRWAAIVHDWLYCWRGASREYSDLVFREVLRSEGANWWQREIMYFAVRVGGRSAYTVDQGLGPIIYI